MQKIKDEIFDYFPCNLDLEDNITSNAEEIRIRLRTTYMHKI